MKNLTLALEKTIQDRVDGIRNLVSCGMSLPEAIELEKKETTLSEKSWQRVLSGLYGDPICEKHLCIKTFCKSSIQDDQGFTCFECLLSQSN